MGLQFLKRRIERLHRLHIRLVLVALIGVLVVGAAAGLAFARTQSAPIGTGVVVIDTNLAYQGGQAAGTGMVLTRSGEVLTNNHVIRGATTIKIVVPDTGHSYKAKVVGYDVSADVAVLQASGASNLKTVSLGNSAKVRSGQSVKAVGNAGGTRSLTRALGKVTAVARAITVSDDQGGTEHLTGLIETSAALQAGDSGGPLLNAAGKVIGMDTAASASFGFQDVSSGDGYAIPINQAVTIAKRIESGKASTTVHVGDTAFLGIEVVANEYGGSGAMVATVVPGGPADSAGLVPADVITTFDGRSTSSPTKLTSLVTRLKPGARVSLSYADQLGQTHTATVVLASGPPQ
ncbi:MAG TPA: trypsin-like peptidase domain-containing protein [Thermoleophilaceae bacterium]|nr:trypsin-like peptidase domain-containing protein [Thermoleophilaceae bacterium]